MAGSLLTDVPQLIEDGTSRPALGASRSELQLEPLAVSAHERVSPAHASIGAAPPVPDDGAVYDGIAHMFDR